MSHRKDFPPEAFVVLEHLRPTIRISPFTGSSMSESATEPATDISCEVDPLDPAVWQNRGSVLTLFRSGWEAITASLRALGLGTSDVVTIITTSGGPYVSSCVTNAIHNVCKTSRVVESHTAAVLLIHEFGFPAAVPDSVHALAVPIIEDCAYAFGTRLRSSRVGSTGDFVIYSLTKILPLPFSGMLISNGSKPSRIPRTSLSEPGATV